MSFRSEAARVWDSLPNEVWDSLPNKVRLAESYPQFCSLNALFVGLKFNTCYVILTFDCLYCVFVIFVCFCYSLMFRSDFCLCKAFDFNLLNFCNFAPCHIRFSNNIQTQTFKPLLIELFFPFRIYNDLFMKDLT